MISAYTSPERVNRPVDSSSLLEKTPTKWQIDAPLNSDEKIQKILPEIQNLLKLSKALLDPRPYPTTQPSLAELQDELFFLRSREKVRDYPTGMTYIAIVPNFFPGISSICTRDRRQNQSRWTEQVRSLLSGSIPLTTKESALEAAAYIHNYFLSAGRFIQYRILVLLDGLLVQCGSEMHQALIQDGFLFTLAAVSIQFHLYFTI
jgi:hypothetical protein